MADETQISPLIAYLRDGETLLWTGQPNPAYFRAKRANEVKLMLVGSTLLMWILGLILLSTNGIHPVTILCFVMGCVNLLCSVVIPKKLPAPKRWYAVTDQRIFSNYTKGETEEMWQLALKDISVVRIKKHEAKVGTILFGSFFHSHVPFECVDDAETVCALINDAKSHSGV